MDGAKIPQINLVSRIIVLTFQTVIKTNVSARKPLAISILLKDI
jgi:hypothetical protein